VLPDTEFKVPRRKFRRVTVQGRVVYDRPTHFFTTKDLIRINNSLKKRLIETAPKKDWQNYVADGVYTINVALMDAIIDNLGLSKQTTGKEVIDTVTGWLGSSIPEDLPLLKKASEGLVQEVISGF